MTGYIAASAARHFSRTAVLEWELAAKTTGFMSWVKKNWLNITAITVAVLPWWQPQWKAAQEDKVRQVAKETVEEQLTPLGQKLDKVAESVAGLSGKTDTLSADVRALLAAGLHTSATLDQQSFDQNLLNVSAQLKTSNALKPKVPPDTLSHIKTHLIDSRERENSALWSARAAFITFDSSISKTKVPSDAANICVGPQIGLEGFVLKIVCNLLTVTSSSTASS